jgi:hypothetical protein
MEGGDKKKNLKKGENRDEKKGQKGVVVADDANLVRKEQETRKKAKETQLNKDKLQKHTLIGWRNKREIAVDDRKMIYEASWNQKFVAIQYDEQQKQRRRRRNKKRVSNSNDEETAEESDDADYQYLKQSKELKRSRQVNCLYGQAGVSTFDTKSFHTQFVACERDTSYVIKFYSNRDKHGSFAKGMSIESSLTHALLSQLTKLKNEIAKSYKSEIISTPIINTEESGISSTCLSSGTSTTTSTTPTTSTTTPTTSTTTPTISKIFTINDITHDEFISAQKSIGILLPFACGNQGGYNYIILPLCAGDLDIRSEWCDMKGLAKGLSTKRGPSSSSSSSSSSKSQLQHEISYDDCAKEYDKYSTTTKESKDNKSLYEKRMLKMSIGRVYTARNIHLNFRYVHDVLRGLRNLHKLGVCSMDTKKYNMCMKDGHAMLSDHEGALLAVTCPWKTNYPSTLSTEAYSPPEFHRRYGTPSMAWDIWGFACVYSFMLGIPVSRTTQNYTENRNGENAIKLALNDYQNKLQDEDDVTEDKDGNDDQVEHDEDDDKEYGDDTDPDQDDQDNRKGNGKIKIVENVAEIKKVKQKKDHLIKKHRVDLRLSPTKLCQLTGEVPSWDLLGKFNLSSAYSHILPSQLYENFSSHKTAERKEEPPFGAVYLKKKFQGSVNFLTQVFKPEDEKTMCDVLNSMLRFDLRDRPSALEILSHPCWSTVDTFFGVKCGPIVRSTKKNQSSMTTTTPISVESSVPLVSSSSSISSSTSITSMSTSTPTTRVSSYKLWKPLEITVGTLATSVKEDHDTILARLPAEVSHAARAATRAFIHRYGLGNSGTAMLDVISVVILIMNRLMIDFDASEIVISCCNARQNKDLNTEWVNELLLKSEARGFLLLKHAGFCLFDFTKNNFEAYDDFEFLQESTIQQLLAEEHKQNVLRQKFSPSSDL